MAVKDDVVQAVYRCINTDEENGWGSASFTLDPLQQILLMETMERDGHELGAIYHSHPGMSATPSMIDEDYAANWPDVVWIIVGLRNGKLRKWRRRLTPDVWAWRMDEFGIYTAELTIT